MKNCLFPPNPLCLVHCSNINSDLIAASEDEVDAMHVPLTNKLPEAALIVQLAELSQYRYEDVWINVKKITDRKFLLCDFQSGHVENLIVSTCALSFDCRNKIISATWLMECNLTETLMKNAIAELSGRKVIEKYSW